VVSSFALAASLAPRRQALLRQVGLRFQALDVEVEETPLPGESAEELVRRLAHEKARAGWRAPSRRLSVPVLGADTAVVLDSEVLGNPLDCPDAMRMLGKLSDRSHRMLSAVALVWEGREEWRLTGSRVWFRTLSESERRRYCATDEVMAASAYCRIPKVAPYACSPEPYSATGRS
jgi:septum formation protein